MEIMYLICNANNSPHMKKIFYAVALLAIPTLVVAQASTKDKLRKSQIDKCKLEIKEKMSQANIKAEDIQTFCECNADKIFSKFTVEEVQKMDDIMAKGSAQEKQAVNEKIMPVVMPCFADLQMKMK